MILLLVLIIVYISITTHCSDYRLTPDLLHDVESEKVESYHTYIFLASSLILIRTTVVLNQKCA